MIAQESQLPIARPPAEVFAFVSDMTNAPRWQTGLHEVRRLTPGPLRVGTEHDFVRRFAGREVASRNRFVAFDPGRFVAFEFPQGAVTGRGSYRVEPDGHGGAVLTSRVELEPKGVMRLAQPVLARVLRHDVRRDDQALKAVLEHAGAPVRPAVRHDPDRTRRVTRWAAGVAGVTGCAANVLLAVLYAGRGTSVGVQGAAEWAGPANDVVGAVSSAAMVPMALGLLACLGRPRGLVVATSAAVGAMVVNVAAGVLLLLDVIPFSAQVAAAVPAVAVIFGWLLLVGRAGRATRRLRASLSIAAVTIGAGLLAALALVGGAALLPAASPGQLLLGGMGLTLGAAAFVAYPIWLLGLARSLHDIPAAIEAATLHVPARADDAPVASADAHLLDVGRDERSTVIALPGSTGRTWSP
jgi:hypothetical protein